MSQPCTDPLGDGISQLELIDFMGGDVKTVNAARISYAKRVTEITDPDLRLIRYLGRNAHESPFRHTYLSVVMKAPLFVARQTWKHVVGGSHTFPDMPWNEVSGRYVEWEPEFYIPTNIRKQSKTNKQGSEGSLTPIEAERWKTAKRIMYETAYILYKEQLAEGVAKEIARMDLPQALYVQWIWTASLQAMCHFVNLRTHSGAQWETRQYANGIKDICLQVAPHSTRALLGEKT